MSEITGISWTDHTFNPWEGCQRVSPGCEHCYAETRNARFHPAENGKPSHWGPLAPRLMRSEAYWKEPLRWNARAKDDGVRRRVFCASLSDVFEDRPDLVAPRERLFDLVEQCDALDWQLLTKRPENMTRLASRWKEWPNNVWAGTTMEDRLRVLSRFGALSTVPAHVKFVSCEPLLEGLGSYVMPDSVYSSAIANLFDWIIVGGESGIGARPFHLEWAREVVAACRTTEAAVFVKQMGSNAYEGGQRVRLRDRAGADPLEWPEDLRVQMLPGDKWT